MRYCFLYAIHIKGYIMAVSLEKNVCISKENLKSKAMQRAIESDLEKGIFANYYKVVGNKIFRKVNGRMEPTGIGFA